MNVLILAKKIPFLENDGESIAISRMAYALNKAGAKIDLISFNTSKHFVDLEKNSPPEYINDFVSVPLDNKIKVLPLFLDLIRNRSHNISRFISHQFEQELIDKIKVSNYDIVQIESLFMTPYIDIIKKYSKAKIVMRSHNIEHIIWEKLSQNESGILKSRYFKLCANLLKKEEYTRLSTYDLLTPISAVDEKLYKSIAPLINSYTVPVGMHIKEKTQFNSAPMSLSFIGSLDWRPNEEGLIWFLDNVWKQLSTANPDLVLNIAGRNSEGKLMKYRGLENIRFHGEVQSSEAFILNHGIMIVPLFSGSGMRVKIVEGMSMGIPIISTEKGAEGIPYKLDRDILIANDEKEFVEKLQMLLKDDDKKNMLAQNAYLLAKKNFDNLTLGSKLFEKYRSLISQSN